MCLQPRRSNPKSRPYLSIRRKHLKISGEENKHLKRALNPEDQALNFRIKSFKSDIESEDVTFVHP